MRVISSKDTKARKEHTCDYCGRTIKKGEVYEYSKNIFNGDIYTWKGCKDCLEFIQKFDVQGDNNGVTYEDVEEVASDECYALGIDSAEMTLHEKIVALLERC